MNEQYKESTAIVFGNSGGIGACIYKDLVTSGKYGKVLGFNRRDNPNFDITSEKSIENLAEKFLEKNSKIKLIFNATGYLHDKEFLPEKKAQDINLYYMKKSFEINSIANALLIKHFAPLMIKSENSIFACLSARVGSISDNFLGGWYSYRASKAALNQIIKTAAIEFKRKNINLIFAAIHPGTVFTKLSEPFVGKRKVMSGEEASKKIIDVLYTLTPEDSGLLIDYNKYKINF